MNGTFIIAFGAVWDELAARAVAADRKPIRFGVQFRCVF
jgi:hypothetical protein